MFKISIGLLFAILSLNVYAGDNPKAPDLSALSESGYIMGGPSNSGYSIDKSWQTLTTIMKNVAVFDSIVTKIEDVVCSRDQNKSILIVGEPSLAYQYIFARLAASTTGKCSKDMWHIEVNINKIEAGHKYVGEVDEYWEKSILKPSDGKDVILYLNSIGSLIGLGSHANDDTGIEREYSSNISSGRLRSVAFIDKYEYNDVIRSKNSYVLEAFADKIILPSVDAKQTFLLVDTLMKTVFPYLLLNERELNYIIKTIEFYSPNRQEPDRTMSVINSLVRGASSGAGKPINMPLVVETPHPYEPNSKVEFIVEKPEVQSLQLVFEFFDIEAKFDYLEVRNADNNALYEVFNSNLDPNFETQFYPTNKLKLVFISDQGNQKKGFKISQVNGVKYDTKAFTLEEVRKATMTVAQVPEWLITRNYTVVKELEAKLNGDVVGVKEGKKDLIRLAKNGYVAGRTDNKPIGTTLLAGPTGTGKSYIAQKMAEFMGMKLITMDMTSYKDPSSYRNFVEIMARNLTNNPYAMYLFEEIDKASVAVLDQLFFMMDEGVFYDSFQRPLFARGAFIMMTTNAGADVILNNPNDPDLRNKVLKDLRNHFRDSFLNRFDAISLFKPFTNEEFLQLSHTLINKKIGKIRNFFDWTLSVDEETYNYVSTYGRSSEYGARPIERLVEGTLGIGIADFQLEYGSIPAGSVIKITKLEETHKFKITANGQSLEYTVDSQSLKLFFQNMKNNMRNKKLFKVLTN